MMIWQNSHWTINIKNIRIGTGFQQCLWEREFFGRMSVSEAHLLRWSVFYGLHGASLILRSSEKLIGRLIPEVRVHGVGHVQPALGRQLWWFDVWVEAKGWNGCWMALMSWITSSVRSERKRQTLGSSSFLWKVQGSERVSNFQLSASTWTFGWKTKPCEL